jgi:hypothetical protein
MLYAIAPVRTIIILSAGNARRSMKLISVTLMAYPSLLKRILMPRRKRIIFKSKAYVQSVNDDFAIDSTVLKRYPMKNKTENLYDKEKQNILTEIRSAMEEIEYGEVVITIHDSEVVQIEKKVKRRFK